MTPPQGFDGSAPNVNDSRYAGLHSGPISFESPLAQSSRSGTGAHTALSALEQIGPYRLTRQIGRGGMGVVYEALDIRLQRRVAIKLLLNPSTADTRNERFLREATSTARLTHPNIVHVHDVGHANGRDYIVMMFVEGVTLAEALRSKVFSYREIATILESIATTVHFAHLQSVIHRDLKPANIMLTGGPAHGSSFLGAKAESAGDIIYTPIVMDFGLAKDLSQSEVISQSGQLMGTPSYMSPEQAEGRLDSIGPTSDVYSLGATLYEALTGRPPFSGASPVQIVEAVLNDDPIMPRIITPRIPRDLETICLKCLEKLPARRYSSAEALAMDLRAWLRGDSITARPRSGVYRAWRICLKHPTISSSVLLGVLGLGVAMALVLRNEHLKQQVLLDRENSRKVARERNIQVANASFEEAQIVIRFSGGLESAPDDILHTALNYCEDSLREMPSNSEAQALTQKIGRILFDRAMRLKNWQSAREAQSILGRYSSSAEMDEVFKSLSQAQKEHGDFILNRVWELFEDAKSSSNNYSREQAVAELTSMRSDQVANEIALYLDGRSPKCTLLALEALAWQGRARFAGVFIHWIKPTLLNGVENPIEFQQAALRGICLNDETEDLILYKAVAQRIADEPGMFNSELYRSIARYYVPYARRRSAEFKIKADLPEEK